MMPRTSPASLYFITLKPPLGRCTFSVLSLSPGHLKYKYQYDLSVSIQIITRYYGYLPAYAAGEAAPVRRC